MSIFKKKNKVTDLIIDFIKGYIPHNIVVTNTLGPKINTIFIRSKAIGIAYDYDISNNIILDELSDVDKEIIIDTIVIPALETLDADLFRAHENIKKNLKNLKNLKKMRDS